jgi:hypothetical protein
MNNCRSCNAQIIWAKTRTGKNMPIDYEPSPKGNVTIRNGIATVHNAPVPGGRMAHHATCIHGADWKAPIRVQRNR